MQSSSPSALSIPSTLHDADSIPSFILVYPTDVDSDQEEKQSKVDILESLRKKAFGEPEDLHAIQCAECKSTICSLECLFPEPNDISPQAFRFTGKK